MNPQSQPEAGASPTSSPSTKQIPARVRVLLIDDDDEFRESLSLNLMDEGFAVTTFANGPAVLEHVAAGETADVILLDWRMPGMNGFEVLRELRQRGAMTPVIFLTVLSDDIHEEAALAGGAVDFIDKSRRLSILVPTYRAHRGGSAAITQLHPATAAASALGRARAALRHQSRLLERLRLRLDADRVPHGLPARLQGRRGCLLPRALRPRARQ